MVIVAAVIQGATVQQIGFGPLSVSFAKPDSGGNANPPPGGNTGNTNTGNNNTGNTNTTGDGSTGGSNVGNQTSGDLTVKGSWTGTHVSLTMQVTEVDLQDGHIRLHVKVTNDGEDTVNLPLFGYFTATDDKDTTYSADTGTSSTAVFDVPAGGFATGIIQLTPRATAGATTLKISFTTIFGLRAPSGGISVSGIPIPH
jgi:hypothetical protein